MLWRSSVSGCTSSAPLGPRGRADIEEDGDTCSFSCLLESSQNQKLDSGVCAERDLISQLKLANKVPQDYSNRTPARYHRTTATRQFHGGGQGNLACALPRSLRKRSGACEWGARKHRLYIQPGKRSPVVNSSEQQKRDTIEQRKCGIMRCEIISDIMFFAFLTADQIERKKEFGKRSARS